MNLDDAFWPALWDLATASGTRPEVLLAVWAAESGLDPHAKNSIGCIGLNQTCPKPVGPGFPNDDPATYQAAPASVQVAWITPQVLSAVQLNGGPFLSAARYYQSNFLPATLAKAKRPGDVIAARHGPYARAYAANLGLDPDHRGAITLATLGKALERRVLNDQGFTDAVATAYAQQPPDAPWTVAQLVLYEPGASTGRNRWIAGLFLAAVFGAAILKHR
jgi:hypothetical protein